MRSVIAAASLVAAAACSGTSAGDAPRGELRSLAGAHARAVWVQGDGTDPRAAGDQLVLMGLDTEDGKGERVILGERRSYVKPLLTPRGARIVFSSRVLPGPPETFIVNWDGSGLRKLAGRIRTRRLGEPSSTTASGCIWVLITINTTSRP